MRILSTPTTLVLFALFMLLLSSLYVVNEGEQAIVLKLGKLVFDDETQQPAVRGAGLHMKIPVIEQLRIFDVRLQTLEPNPSRIVTAEQKDVIVDYFVKWKISDPALYFQRTGGNTVAAKNLLSQQINDKLRAEFGHRTIAEVVTDHRLQVMEDLRAQVNANAKILGIRVIDVRIKRIDLPDEVSARVFERMRATRKVVATEHRATGRAEAEAIRARARAAASIKMATAQEGAANLRAQGDAIAAKIYADTYGKDPEFYEFYRSINAYKSVFSDKKDILVLQPEGDFFRHFGKGPAKQNTQQPKARP